MTNLILFWHRRDLRLDDNIGFHKAQQHSQNVVGIFCFDPQLLQSKQVAKIELN
jgi:deoxyribodipyrimidine photo-lyase